MPNLMSLGQKGPGAVLTDAYQIGSEWLDAYVLIEVEVPANQNTTGRSVSFYVEVSDSETGPWLQRGGLHWEGGNTPGKDGTWNPGKGFIVTPDLVGLWVRGRLELPVRMRCGVDIDVVT